MIRATAKMPHDPEPVVELILVRCGRAEAPAGTLRGQADLALAVDGFTAMQRLATHWSGAPPRFLFCSDQRRALQSAQVLAGRFALEPLADARLRELDLGRWNGLNFAQAAATAAQDWQRWNADWLHHAAPGGETFTQLQARAGAWLDAVLAAAQRDDRVLAVTHEGSIRALLCRVLGLELLQARALRVDCASVSAIAFRDGRFEVSYLNCPQFLSD